MPPVCCSPARPPAAAHSLSEPDQHMRIAPMEIGIHAGYAGMVVVLPMSEKQGGP